MKALVVGGTGPTGPLITQGLLDRGYEVSIYHRGYHEAEEMPKVHHHIHGDPFSKETFEEDMAGQTWDLVVSMYGRLRHVADVVAGRTPKLIGAGGTPSLMKPEHLPFPRGLELPLPEGHPLYFERELNRYGFAVAHTERQVMEHHKKGAFAAVIFRYTAIYGPRAPRQWMWAIAKRIRDGRKQILVPGDGSQIRLTCYAENAAHMILLACDKDEGDGHVFNAVDEVSFTVKDTITMVANEMGYDIEIVEISHPLAYEMAAGYAPRRSSQVNIFNLKSILGYRDAVSPYEGVRRTTRWMLDNWEKLDHSQLQSLMKDPLAYSEEDELIASVKTWQHKASATIRLPKVPDLSEGDWRGTFRP